MRRRWCMDAASRSSTPPARREGRRAEIPTLQLFVNSSDLLRAYERYLRSANREWFDLRGLSVKIVMRGRTTQSREKTRSQNQAQSPAVNADPTRSVKGPPKTENKSGSAVTRDGAVVAAVYDSSFPSFPSCTWERYCRPQDLLLANSISRQLYLLRFARMPVFARA